MEEQDGFESDENLEFVIELDDDSFENDDTLLYNSCDNMSATSSPFNLSQYSFDDEPQVLTMNNHDNDDDEDDNDNDFNDDDHNENNDDDGDSLSSYISSCESIDIKNDINKDNYEIKISEQALEKKKVSTAVNTSINKTLNAKQKKSDSLNLNRINTPKTNTSIHNFNSSLISDQKKKKNSLTSEKPITKELPCQSSIDEINCNESFSNPEQGLEIELPEDLNPDVYVISHNNVNYVVNKNDLTNKNLLQLLSSGSPDVPIKQSTPPSSKVKQNVIKKRVPKAIPRMQKLPNGKYKMVPPHVKDPVDFVSLRRSPKFDDEDQNKISLLDAHKQNKQVSPEKPSRDISIDFIDKKNKKKPIPHTATSRDVIKHHDPIPSEDNDINLKSEEKCMLSKCIQPSPNSRSLILSDDLPLSNIRRHG